MSDELIDVFVEEGRELAQQASAALETLADRGADPEAFDSLFRAFHTLKGSAGLMAFAPMSEIFHAAEDRLSEIRVISQEHGRGHDLGDAGDRPLVA